MEAITSLALACNVIQLIDFSFKAAEVYKEFKEHGATIDIQSLDETSNHLTKATTDLENSLSAARCNGPPSHMDADLTALSKKVCDVAGALHRELESLRTVPGSSRKTALIKTLKFKRRASHIEHSTKNLDQYVQVLQTKILSRLRRVTFQPPGCCS